MAKVAACQLANWPPSRGKNPHTHNIKYAIAVTHRKDGRPPKKLTREEIKQRREKAKKFLEEAEKKTKKGKKGKKKWFTVKRGRRKPRPLVGTWDVDYQVVAVASLTLEQAVRILSGTRIKPDVQRHDRWILHAAKPLTVTLNYPLSRSVTFTVPPLRRLHSGCRVCKRKGLKTKDMSLGAFLWIVAKEYQRIYRSHRKYGVWGHAIGDLWFERIIINREGKVHLFIGS
jgi:hypothetical protein